MQWKSNHWVNGLNPGTPASEGAPSSHTHKKIKYEKNLNILLISIDLKTCSISDTNVLCENW